MKRSVQPARAIRVLLIGRRFWPHGTNNAAGHLIQIASGLQQQGAAVEVLTPRYASGWPSELTFRELKVHRPMFAPRRDWSLGRYTRAMTQWLRSRTDEYDVIVCDAIREEAIAAVTAAGADRCRVVLRCAGYGESADPYWWTTSRAARRCGGIGMLADAVVATNADAQRALLIEGYEASKIARIDPGFPVGSQRSSDAKWRARQSLGAANSDLVTKPTTPVLVCASAMTAQSEVTKLVQAARHLVRRFPELKLWFVGDGPRRDWIYDTLRGDGLRNSIAMPGSFADVQDILAAADLFFQCEDQAIDFWLPSAIAAALPIVSVESPLIRGWINGISTSRSSVDEWTKPNRPPLNGSEHSVDPASSVHWCDTDDAGAITAKSIRIAVANALENMVERRRTADSLRKLVLRHRPHSATAQSYVRLFQSLLDQPRRIRRDESIGAST